MSSAYLSLGGMAHELGQRVRSLVAGVDSPIVAAAAGALGLLPPEQVQAPAKGMSVQRALEALPSAEDISKGLGFQQHVLALPNGRRSCPVEVQACVDLVRDAQRQCPEMLKWAGRVSRSPEQTLFVACVLMDHGLRSEAAIDALCHAAGFRQSQSAAETKAQRMTVIEAMVCMYTGGLYDKAQFARVSEALRARQ